MKAMETHTGGKELKVGLDPIVHLWSPLAPEAQNRLIRQVQITHTLPRGK